MIEINDEHKGSLTLTQDTNVRGIVTGDVIVTPNVSAIISGIVNGQVLVGKDSRARVSGIVNKQVVNDGGYVEVSGIVNEGVNTLAGETKIIPGAIV